MRFSKIIVYIVLIPTLFWGQQTEIIKKQLNAVFTNESIVIDGNFKETIWQNVPVANDFYAFEPINGSLAPNNLKSEVKIVYDNNAIYIAATLYDSEPSKILKEITERDNFGVSDAFGVFINGYNDGQQDFQFYVTAANGQADCNFTSQDGEDYSFDAIWDCKAKITDFGWVVEMKIPYAALRFPNTDIQTWGINFFREVRRDRQKYTWNLINNQIGTFSQQAGILNGIQKIAPPTRLFLIPYASSYINANKDQTDFTQKVGLDIKYGINDAFTLDAILIPDFGQARFDDVILNLGPFEQQFNENRPFFTEGTDMFSKGNLLYSRRIGENPNIEPKFIENETLINRPRAINLLNAMKISGRDKDGLGIGFLNAITEKTTAIAKNNLTDEERNVIVSPLTNYNVTVFDQRFNQNSSVTVINTNVTRNGNFRDANVFGTLFNINNKQNSFNVSGEMKMSSIMDTQNSSGYNTSLSLAETAGKFRFGGGAEFMSKDFDNNDLGINFITNYYALFSNASYRILNPTKTFNTFRVNFNSYFEFYTPTNQLQESNFNVNVNTTDKKNHYYGGGFNINPFKNYDFYEPRVTDRFFVNPANTQLFLFFSSNYNNKFALDFNPYFTQFINDNRNISGFSLSPRYRFDDAFSLIYAFDYDRLHNDVGWIDFDDNNIIFAKRNRVNYTNSLSSKFSINSNMNFNLTVRHYWSVVENNSINNLNLDGSLSQNTTYLENKNSNFNTWNLDLSYSWWFAPGSQMQVLYRNNAATFDRNLNRDFGNNFTTLLQDNLNHVFSISIRYFIDYNQAKNLLK
jgi:hypothetical protein